MLSFRNLPWLCVRGGATTFNAYISISDRKGEDVMWSLDFRYIAAGAAWRRVRSWERPSLWIDVNQCTPCKAWRIAAVLARSS